VKRLILIVLILTLLPVPLKAAYYRFDPTEPYNLDGTATALDTVYVKWWYGGDSSVTHVLTTPLSGTASTYQFDSTVAEAGDYLIWMQFVDNSESVRLDHTFTFTAWDTLADTNNAWAEVADTTGIPASVYAEFIDGSNEDEFKANVSALAVEANIADNVWDEWISLHSTNARAREILAALAPVKSNVVTAGDSWNTTTKFKVGSTLQNYGNDNWIDQLVIFYEFNAGGDEYLTYYENGDTTIMPQVRRFVDVSDDSPWVEINAPLKCAIYNGAPTYDYSTEDVIPPDGLEFMILGQYVPVDTNRVQCAEHAQVDSLKDTVEALSANAPSQAQVDSLLDSAGVIHAKLFGLGLADSAQAGAEAGVLTVGEIKQNVIDDTTTTLAYATELGLTNMIYVWSTALNAAYNPDGKVIDGSTVAIRPDFDNITGTLDKSTETTGFADSANAEGACTGGGTDPLHVYALNTDDSTAINDIMITVNTEYDASGSRYYALTDGSGLAVFGMSEGDELLMLTSAAGWSFTQDSIVKGAGTDTDTLWGTQWSPGAPVSAEACSVYGWLYDVESDSVAGATIIFELTSDQDTLYYDNVTYLKGRTITESNQNGYWSINVIPNALLDTASCYSVDIIRHHKRMPILSHFDVYVPDSATVKFIDLVKNFNRKGK
jgi:hypothetical protein